MERKHNGARRDDRERAPDREGSGDVRIARHHPSHAVVESSYRSIDAPAASVIDAEPLIVFPACAAMVHVCVDLLRIRATDLDP